MAKLIVTGDKQVDAALKRIGDPGRTNKIVRAAMRSAMKGIADLARANTPVASGAMRKAIKVVAAKRSRKGPSVRVVIDAARIAQKVSKDGKKGWYPATVEYGSEAEGREPEAPMRRAYDSGKLAARDRCVAEVRDNVLAIK